MPSGEAMGGPFAQRGKIHGQVIFFLLGVYQDKSSWILGARNSLQK
jgi:hypothetical protein